MEDRQDREDRVAFAHVAPRRGLQRQRNEIAIGEHDALGRPGSAAREQDRGGIMRGCRRARHRGLRRAHERCQPPHARIGRHCADAAPFGEPEPKAFHRRQVVGDAGEDQDVERHPRADRREAVVEGVESEGDPRPGRVEVALDFGRGRQRMDERRHRAKLVRCIEGDDGLRRGRHRHDDALAGFQPECRERIGAGVDGYKKFLISRGRVEEIPGYRIGRAPCRVNHRLIQRDLRIGELRGNFPVPAQPRPRSRRRGIGGSLNCRQLLGHETLLPSCRPGGTIEVDQTGSEYAAAKRMAEPSCLTAPKTIRSRTTSGESEPTHARISGDGSH